MPAPARPQLKHVEVRLRVSIDAARWAQLFSTTVENIPDEVRRYAVERMRESPAAYERAIVSARRDQR